ncbi:MAG: hypothetical protein ACFFCP_04405 [Promethearchaeota archaeon]
MKEFMYLVNTLTSMTRSSQTKLSDFGEVEEESHHSSHTVMTEFGKPKERKPERKLWRKTTKKDEEWGVCNFDETVFFVQVIDGKLHAHGMEAVCKWCGGVLEIREATKVFCGGVCGRYQGEFSRDLNAFLHWEGAKSYTLRKIVAEVEALELEARDLQPIQYAPNWSVLFEYEDEPD